MISTFRAFWHYLLHQSKKLNNHEWEIVAAMQERRLGDYGPSSREVIETIGHPTPVPTYDGPGRPPANSVEWDAYWAGNWPPNEVDDGPLTERCPSGLDPLHEVDVDVNDHRELTAQQQAGDYGDVGSNVETVSLFIDLLTPGAIYLVKRPSTRFANATVLEPMYLRTYQNDIVMFQDMMGERLTMGTNLARQSIVKRYTTREMLEALARLV